MNFGENPKIFIIDYYDEKRRQVDLNCENLISQIKDNTEIQDLNELRMSLIKKIESVERIVLERYNAMHPNYVEEMLEIKNKQLKDEIFLDQYCLVLDVYQVYPLFELQIGLLLFTEFDDYLIQNLR